MSEETHSEREFEEAVRRASDRYRKRRAGIDMVWRKTEEDPVYAYHAARRLAAKARYDRRRACRHLRDRFGVEAPTDEDGTEFAYPIVRPGRTPKNARGRLDRAEAVMAHAEAECVWRAVRKCESFAPADQGRMAVKLACEAMRQTPGLWAYFVENERDGSVREHALAEFVGWLDNETKMHREDASREEKLHGLAAVAKRAWEDLRPGEPLYLPNTFVKSHGEQRQKGHLVGRAGRLLDSLPDSLPALGGLRFEREPDDWFYGDSGEAEEDVEAFLRCESARRDLSAIIEKAELSRRQAEVVERKRRGEEVAQIAQALGIRESVVYVHWSDALKKLRRATGQ